MAFEAKGDQLMHEVRQPDRGRVMPSRDRSNPASLPLRNPLALFPRQVQAEQALKKWSLFGGGDKYEDAAEKQQRAGQSYKAAKACKYNLLVVGGESCSSC
jgi:hypothetical protein